MNILAIEQSSSRGSAALLRDGTIEAEQSWEYAWHENSPSFAKTLFGLPRGGLGCVKDFAEAQPAFLEELRRGKMAVLATEGFAKTPHALAWGASQLFAVLSELLANAPVKLSEVDVFAVGLGPGSFAGTRIAVSAARAFALPGGNLVFGVSSGEALARDIYRETGAGTIVVLGDARRQHVWYALFEKDARSLSMTRPWSLKSMDGLREISPEGSVVAGPDWDRLGDGIKDACSAGVALIEERRYPSARSVGMLAAERMRDNRPSEPLSPLYLHPPVFVEPRFGFG